MAMWSETAGSNDLVDDHNDPKVAAALQKAGWVKKQESHSAGNQRPLTPQQQLNQQQWLLQQATGNTSPMGGYPSVTQATARSTVPLPTGGTAVKTDPAADIRDNTGDRGDPTDTKVDPAVAQQKKDARINAYLKKTALGSNGQGYISERDMNKALNDLVYNHGFDQKTAQDYIDKFTAQYDGQGAYVYDRPKLKANRNFLNTKGAPPKQKSQTFVHGPGGKDGNPWAGAGAKKVPTAAETEAADQADKVNDRAPAPVTPRPAAAMGQQQTKLDLTAANHDDPMARQYAQTILSNGESDPQYIDAMTFLDAPQKWTGGYVSKPKKSILSALRQFKYND